jgi:hypothetical protein
MRETVTRNMLQLYGGLFAGTMRTPIKLSIDKFGRKPVLGKKLLVFIYCIQVGVKSTLHKALYPHTE